MNRKIEVYKMWKKYTIFVVEHLKLNYDESI